MDYTKLGRTGLKVSRLCLGTMQWGWTADQKSSFSVMDTFIEHGGNFFDTADFYSRYVPGNAGGESETIIGRWLKERHNRDNVILATKVRQPMGSEPNDQGLSRKHILQAIDASLSRLQTDYIDLYQAHAFDADTPIDETLKTFDDLQCSGKVRYIGASNYPAWRLVEALWSADVHNTVRFDSLEPHYNLAYRQEFESDLKTICEQYQLGVIPYSSQANGFLTGKYIRGKAAESSRAESVMKRYDNERSWNTLDTVQRIAQELHSSPSAISLAWLLAQPVITAPIIGANSPTQLKPSLSALDVHFTPDHLTQLNKISEWQN